MSNPKTITIDDVEYVRADSVSHPIKGNRVIAILDKGWIMVGNLRTGSNGQYTLSSCQNLRRWGKGGFGLVTKDPKAAGVVLDDCADIEFPERSMIAMVPIAEDWG